MCEPSKITEDWVTKGMHIHIDEVELNIYTNHKGGVDFRAVFSSTSAAALRGAIKTAREKCLPDPAMRRRWMQRLDMARVYMVNYQGTLAAKANGRMLDFKFIKVALEQWEKRNANS